MSNFKIGQKVVCVDAPSNENRKYKEYMPVKNEIYTIRGFYRESLYLEEIINEVYVYDNGVSEVSFKSCRFRPLDHQFAEDVIAYITELELQES